MLGINRRKRNCTRNSVNAEPVVQCQQKQQRIRCCGRVITEAELNNQSVAGLQSQVDRNRLNQNQQNKQDQGIRNRQGSGNSQGQGLRNGQGSGNGQGKGCR